MKRTIKTLVVTLSIMLFSLSTFAQGNFGIGLSSTNSFSRNPYYYYNNNDWWGGAKLFSQVRRDVNLNLSVIYDYTLNKNVSLGVSPTYRFNYTNLAWLETSGLGEERQYSHCLDIPIYADYKWRITDNNKLFAGLGVSGMFDLGSDEFTMKRDLFTSYAVFRLGFEVEIKYRLQFLMQYRWNMNKSAVSGDQSWSNPSYPMPLRSYEKFRVNTLDFGINIFL